MFKKHRKSDHIENVQICKMYKEGNCTFGEHCWFSHESTENKKEEKENNDKIIQKLFEVVEKFTEKVITVEKIVMEK